MTSRVADTSQEAGVGENPVLGPAQPWGCHVHDGEGEISPHLEAPLGWAWL